LICAFITPLLFSPTVAKLYSLILSDSPVFSTSLAASGLLLMLMRTNYNRAPLWLAFILAVFACIISRPAYLFLLAALPIQAWLLLQLRRSIMHDQDLTTGPSRVRVRSVILACWIPYFAFSVIRFASVGHFGIVSSGGFNLSGLITQMVYPEDIPDISQEFRPLSEFVIQEQNRRNLIHKDAEGRRISSALNMTRDFSAYLQIVNDYGNHAGMHSSGELSNFLSRYCLSLIKLKYPEYIQWLKGALGIYFLSIPSPWIVFWAVVLIGGLEIYNAIVAPKLLSRKLIFNVPPFKKEFVVLLIIGLVPAVLQQFILITSIAPIERCVEPALIWWVGLVLSFAVCQAFKALYGTADQQVPQVSDTSA